MVLLKPPQGYDAWLDYAVATMETRSLFLSECAADDGERQWPEDTQRADMRQAAAAELAALRAGAHERRRLPTKRYGKTIQARISGHKIYVRTGEYPDGTIGEVFVDMYKEGAAFRCTLHCFARLFSLALQYGMPLQVLVDSFRGETFEPSGSVEGHLNITTATSIIDYIMQALEAEAATSATKGENQ